MLATESGPNHGARTTLGPVVAPNPGGLPRAVDTLRAAKTRVVSQGTRASNPLAGVWAHERGQPSG